jgi:hypothetical protein
VETGATQTQISLLFNDRLERAPSVAPQEPAINQPAQPSQPNQTEQPAMADQITQPDQPVQQAPRRIVQSAPWQNKWIYLGGSLGGGGYWYDQYSDRGYYEGYYDFDTSGLFAGGLNVEFALLRFFSIELMLGIGGDKDEVIPVLPILARVGGKIARIELTFDAGYTFDMGFTLGGTFGVNLGQGILFTKFLGIHKASPIDHNMVAAWMGFVGYKVGFINKR